MLRSTLLLALCLACASGPTPSERAEAIHDAVAAWRADPSQARLDRVLAVSEAELARGSGDADVDVALGDALANVLLRPDLGIARLEPHADAAPDAWMDALLRAHRLDALGAAHAKRFGTPLFVDHPTAMIIASQAAVDANVHWRDLADGVMAARLIEAGLSIYRRELDVPVDSVAQLLGVLALMHGDNVVAAIGRSTLPGDADPLSTPGEVPAANDRRRVLSFADAPTELAKAGALLDAKKTPRAATIVVQLGGIDGPIVCVEGSYENGALTLVSTTDVPRTAPWLAALDAWQTAGHPATPDAALAARLAAWGAEMRTPPAP